MQLVIDANILFAALIKEGINTTIIGTPNIQFLAPAYLYQELEKHKEFILEKTTRTPEEFSQLLTHLKENITTLTDEELEPYGKTATTISPDPGDIAYFATALHSNCPIWSNDKRLKQQKLIPIITTQELITLLTTSTS
ncbi:MAG TPA: PIN domain-containing protein [Candidatus Nanoarchaeia archaeon]|nr:PIN domain-containing protein [Candidatus Nanoarchaeia archaeon]